MKIFRETLIYPIFDVESDFEVYFDCKSCLKELGYAAVNQALYVLTHPCILYTIYHTREVP